MKRFIFAAMLVLATVTVSNAQVTQPAQATKVYAKAIDSTIVLGTPVNSLVIRNFNTSGSTVVVQSALVYTGKASTGTKATLSFTDTWEVSDTTRLSYASIAAALAQKRGVRIK